jgi:hypothetical protein
MPYVFIGGKQVDVNDILNNMKPKTPSNPPSILKKPQELIATNKEVNEIDEVKKHVEIKNVNDDLNIDEIMQDNEEIEKEPEKINKEPTETINNNLFGVVPKETAILLAVLLVVGGSLYYFDGKF